MAETVGGYIEEWGEEITLPERQVILQALIGLSREVPLEEFWQAESRFQALGTLYEAFREKRLAEEMGSLEEQHVHGEVQVVHPATGMKATGKNAWQARENLQKSLETTFAGFKKQGVVSNDLNEAWQSVFDSMKHDLLWE